MQKRILVSYAHPDDESFGLGSLIAKYTAEGTEVTLICATNGDVGSAPQELLDKYGSVAAIRLDELDCAAQVLGLTEVVKLGYRDSGMMGSADNNHPDSLWQAPLERIAEQIVEVIRRTEPQVLITFDPYGGYGHPDHIKIHQATHKALDMLQGDAARPTKVYYAAFPRLLLRIGVAVMKIMGRDPRRLGRNQDLDAQAILDNTLPAHTRINVSRYLEVAERASACHASQANPRQTLAILGPVFRYLSRNMTLTRVEPPPARGEPIETDLFAGLT
jgi:LmbE family N-acetylglucosaminyl deacetylase